jgi:hypothetical protein
MSAFTQSPRRGLIVLGLLVATLVMGAFALPSLGDMGDRGVGIVELETARTTAKAATLYGDLGDAGRDAAKESLYLDYPFLVLYGFFYAALCLVVGARAAERGMTGVADWARPAALAGLLSAACDAVENFALLRVLDGHTDQPWPGVAFTFASAKFLLTTVVLVYVVVGFALTLRRRPAA